VAIFHCQTKPISRSGGRSAVAASAYRAGVELTDERTGIVHDFTRRSGVESADLLLPEGAPDLDRGSLWNQAEAAEGRKDARTAREWVTALPSELGPDERRALALEFAGALVERYGVAVDVAIHAPGRRGDDRNHHAHLLTTTRQVGPEGLSEKAEIELSDKARVVRGLMPARKEIEAVRALWAGLANEHLERAGRSERIDHRSLKAQGIEREPTKHLGPAATAIERANKQSRLRADHQEAAAFKQASAAELATEAKTVSAELAALLEHRTALERQQVEQAARQARHRAEVAAIIERQARGPEAPTAPAIEQPKARAPIRDQAKTPEPPTGRPRNVGKQDPEAVYAALLKPIREREQRAAAATLAGLGQERQQWSQARQAHQADKPGMVRLPGSLAKWERAGDALDAAGRDLARWEGAAARSADPKALEAGAVAELRRVAPGVVEAADQARKERQAREQEARRAEYEKAKIGKDFNSMAVGREGRMFGYTDRAEKWQALPAELKEKIENYNRLPKEQRPKELERITKDQATVELLGQAREISRSQGRGR
jgi:hypothetical protein